MTTRRWRLAGVVLGGMLAAAAAAAEPVEALEWTTPSGSFRLPRVGRPDER